MKARAVIATATAFMMAIGALPWVVTAGAESVPIPITPVPDGGLPVGLYFADNMVFTPQWRTDNYVRIEFMIIDMTNLVDIAGDGVDPTDIPAADIDMYTQAEIIANPSLLANTRMVSVPSIEVTIVHADGTLGWHSLATWDADGNPLFSDGGMGREVNQVGHLIYGGQWDTTDAAEGVYTCYVELADGYNIQFAMGSYKIGEDTLYDPTHPYIELADDELDWQYVEYDIGIGDVAADGSAFLILGQLIGRGSGGGSGGNGNGNGGGGNGGNGNGGGSGHHGGRWQ